MTYHQIGIDHLTPWVNLAHELWPEQDKKELEAEFKQQLQTPEQYRSYLCLDQDNTPIAFINASIRTDYVEGAETRNVGYIEGIFVKKEYRKQGIAKKLVELIETWAKHSGCTEMGSDADLSNKNSHAFHEEIGYKESARVVHFLKKL